MSATDLDAPMTLRERIRAAWIILNADYIERVDIAWKRADENRASRIWVGRR